MATNGFALTLMLMRWCSKAYKRVTLHARNPLALACETGGQIVLCKPSSFPFFKLFPYRDCIKIIPSCNNSFAVPVLWWGEFKKGRTNEGPPLFEILRTDSR